MRKFVNLLVFFINSTLKIIQTTVLNLGVAITSVSLLSPVKRNTYYINT